MIGKFALGLVTALLMVPVFADASNQQQSDNQGADMVSVALEVAKATSAPRVSVPPHRYSVLPLVLRQSPGAQYNSGGTNTIVVEHRGYIAPPTGYHHTRRSSGKPIINKAPNKR